MTDNAMIFTMHNTPHSERRTAFQKKVQALSITHGTIKPGCPWQNGFIERSNRTDNEELFNHTRFTSPEERRYLLRLWEMEYNFHRPHQGLHGKTPFEVFRHNYQLHTKTRMLN